MITHDVVGDVLYVKIDGEVLSDSRALPDDDFVIINYNEQGTAVGLQLLDVKTLDRQVWERYYKRDVPKNLYKMVHAWLPEPEHPGLFRWLASQSGERFMAWHMFLIGLIGYWWTFGWSGEHGKGHGFFAVVLILGSIRLIYNKWSYSRD